MFVAEDMVEYPLSNYISIISLSRGGGLFVKGRAKTKKKSGSALGATTGRALLEQKRPLRATMGLRRKRRPKAAMSQGPNPAAPEKASGGHNGIRTENHA